MRQINIIISDEITKDIKGITLAYLMAYNIDKTDEKILNEFIEKAVREVKSKLTLESLKNDHIIRAYRNFYWHYLKIDPTKIRPSSEALIRRVLRNKPFPRINPIVDLGNAISLLTKICIGIYDLDKIDYDVLFLRRAKEGELFHPIGGKSKILNENYIVLAEDSKIIHIFPHRDSSLTSVTNKTNKILVVACGVPGISKDEVIKALNLFKSVLVKACNAKITEIYISST